jgi:hypothetical protein
VFVLSFLFFDDESVPIFEGVFSPAVEVLHYFRPFLAAPVVSDAAQEEGVLLGSPRAFF